MDKDHDSIPNLAERWELGLNMDLESTDRDKFDDGQELFGVTYCPGSGAAVAMAAFPPAPNDPNIVMFPNMPGFVKATRQPSVGCGLPGSRDEMLDGEDNVQVQTVTTVTTDHIIASGTESRTALRRRKG